MNTVFVIWMCIILSQLWLMFDHFTFSAIWLIVGSFLAVNEFIKMNKKKEVKKDG